MEIGLNPLIVFFIVLARVGGLVTFAPFWGHRAASTKIRVVLAIVLAVALTPIAIGKIQSPPTQLAALFPILLGEITIGLAMGFVGRVVFNALEIAAHFIGSQMGFSLAGTIDPSTQAQTTAFGTIAQMLGLMILLGADGHHWFLTAAVKSFSTTAPGEFAVSPQLLEILVRLSVDSLTVGVTLAAPAIIVLLVVEFALEAFGRVAPQFQMFILGFPIKIAVGFWLIGASLFFMHGALRSVLSGIYQSLARILAVM